MPDGDSHAPALPSPEALLCPLCRQSVSAEAYEDHLQATHALFVYRGVHRPLPDTLEAVRDDLVSTQDREEAWPALLSVAGQQGEDRDAFLAGQLAAAVAAQPASRRGPILQALAPLLLTGPPSLVLALTDREEPAARQLALACIARAPLPLSRPFRRTLRNLLLDRALADEGQADALAQLLPRLDDAALTRDLLRRFIDGLDHGRAAVRLRLLEDRTGTHPVLTPLRERLQEQVRLSCPRCRVELRRPAMIRHLWQEHRLLLDGLHIRDPWDLVAGWLDDYKKSADIALLERCRVAVAKIDPDDGAVRLKQLLLARGLGEPSDHRAVLAAARARHAACCPHCFTLVSVPHEVPALEVNSRPGRLSAGGYAVEINERGMRTWLEVATPDEVIYQGREPDHTWTAQGAAQLGALPLVVLAVLAAAHWPASVGSPLWPVLLLLLLAAVTAGVVRLAWRTWASSSQRLLAYGWQLLVPRLHAGRFVLTDSAFLAGLARLHGRIGLAGVPPSGTLNDLLRVTEVAVQAGEAPPGHLAPLCRLAIERAAADGADPVPLIVRWLTRCFDGKLPLSFAQHLLQDWAAYWWTPGNRARLRVLLCDRAFEAGFEVSSLLEAGQNAPALGAVLRTGVPRPLAALRLLWSLRPTRPWDRLGEVQTAFELAADPGRIAVLAQYPDVLLWQEDPLTPLATAGGGDTMGPATVLLSPMALWLQDVAFHTPPRVFEVRLRSTGCEMTLGEQVFRSGIDLEALSRLLERWFRYAFHEFLPQVEAVLGWQSPDQSALQRAWGAVPCPSCRRLLLPRVGEVGVAVGESR